MKRISKHLLCLFTVALTVGCSDNKFGDDDFEPTVYEGDKAYMTVQVNMPSAPGTRSNTTDDGGSNSGVEIGKDYENNVKRMYVVLARSTDNAFIVCGDMSGRLKQSANKQAYVGTSEITKTQLAEFYNDSKTPTDKKEVNVFIFCNPTDHLIDILEAARYEDTQWYNAICKEGNVDTAWDTTNGGSFLMSNYAIATRKLPNTMNDWLVYSEANPFNLSGINNAGSLSQVDNSEGAVKVERSVARFDFKDGSRDLPSEIRPEAANTYPVVQVINAQGTPGDYIVNVQLGKMALVNMNNSFYYLRRVSDNGLPVNQKLCAPEKPWFTLPGGMGTSLTGNYVVDAWATEKDNWVAKGKEAPAAELSNYFRYPLFNEDGKIDNTNQDNNRWDTQLLSTVLGENSTEDNDNSWNMPNKHGEYRIWRYVTENTVSGASKQVNGITTGIVFKGKMIPTAAASESSDEDTKYLAKVLSYTANGLGNDSYKDPIIYMFGGNLYVTWPKVREAVKAVAYNSETKKWSRSHPLYVAVYGTGGTGETDDALAQDQKSANYKWNIWNDNNKTLEGSYFSDFRKAATNAGITIYQSSQDDAGGWGYYCYYYYWNRHNDNELEGEMAPMEFAVVRNNVYKLAVTKISRLGHPRISDNDPDNPTPETPDERSNIYLSVSVDVRPWVVRVNNIEF